MKAIRKTDILSGSLVERYLPADYTDAFGCEVVGERTFSADDVMVGFWTGQTGWVSALFRLRHFLVRFVGLQGGKPDHSAFEKMIREGGSYRFASVAANNDRETVLLLSDKHLDAWLSVYIDGENRDGTHNTSRETAGIGTGKDADRGALRKTIFVITVVKFHNRLGRVYFFIIRPFHALIVKSLLRKVVKNII